MAWARTNAITRDENRSPIRAFGSPESKTRSTGWSIAETGDFNGDGMSDILWYNNGNVAMRLMSGATVSSSVGVGNVPTVWTIQAAGAD
jgi:hypothetical protein